MTKSSGSKSHLFSSPKNSCFKFIPFRCYVFLLHQVEERKGKDEDGGNGRQALTDWEPGWHDIAIIVIWLLWNVSHRDRMSLSGLIWRVPSSSRLIHLVSGLSGPVSILTLKSFFSDNVYNVGVRDVRGDYEEDVTPCNFACLEVFISIGHCCLAFGDSLLVVSNRRGVWGVFSLGHADETFLSKLYLFLRTKGRWCDIITGLYVSEVPS